MILRTQLHRYLVASVALAALSGCGGNDAQTTTNKSEEVAEAPKVDPALVIQGMVTAPDGHSLDGTKALACLTPQETCLKEAEVPVKVENGVGTYEIVVPQKGDYHVLMWKDVNENTSLDDGDLMAFANNMDAIPSGEKLTPLTLIVDPKGDKKVDRNPGGIPYRMGNPAAAADAVKNAGIAGKWSQQSFGTELVWGPEIKFQAAIATGGFGTNLGGTFGAGSPTNTTITYSYKPVKVKRTTSLDVAPDGTFHMVAQMERRTGKCTPVREERFGHVRQEAGKTIFAVADVRQQCGKGKMEKLKIDKADYVFAAKDNGFTLSGDKGANLSFSKN
ncbi:hypothetical protein [Allosphingosinicella vermicomposti]|uniref:hypothetical protein n=1 Tax=Allosphingosinicella vermicomposti TaxID=614671 RepID=UPI000D0ED436|nr:hypothetical protein [Allosphingosinicella vermicomposti]